MLGPPGRDARKVAPQPNDANTPDSGAGRRRCVRRSADEATSREYSRRQGKIADSASSRVPRGSLFRHPSPEIWGDLGRSGEIWGDCRPHLGPAARPARARRAPGCALRRPCPCCRSGRTRRSRRRAWEIRRRYGGDMAEIWRRYGGDMAEIWRRYGGDMAVIWRSRRRVWEDRDGRYGEMWGDRARGEPGKRRTQRVQLIAVLSSERWGEMGRVPQSGELSGRGSER